MRPLWHNLINIEAETLYKWLTSVFVFAHPPPLIGWGGWDGGGGWLMTFLQLREVTLASRLVICCRANRRFVRLDTPALSTHCLIVSDLWGWKENKRLRRSGTRGARLKFTRQMKHHKRRSLKSTVHGNFLYAIYLYAVRKNNDLFPCWLCKFTYKTHSKSNFHASCILIERDRISTKTPERKRK